MKLERPVLISALAAFKVVIAAVIVAWVARHLIILRNWDTEPSDYVFVAVALGLAAIALLCAHGLWKLRWHGWWLQLFFSSLSLVIFPVGTVFGGLVITYLFRRGVRLMFSGRDPSSFDADEIQALVAVDVLPSTHSTAFAVCAVLLPTVWAGCVASIAIPNLLGAIDRGKQKRSMADLRAIAVALEMYRVDHNAYPVASSIDAMQARLEPKYIQDLPSHDGWSRRYQVDVSATGYTIFSRGKDGTGENCEPAVTYEFTDEICFSNGEFIRFPQGTQQ